MGIHLPQSNFQPPCPPSSFPYFVSHTPFSELPIEENSEIQKSIEAMLYSQQQILQNILDLLFQPKFQESYSSFQVPLIQNAQPSVLNFSMELA